MFVKMLNRSRELFLFPTLLVLSFVIGSMITEYKIFPYHQIKFIKYQVLNKLNKYSEAPVARNNELRINNFEQFSPDVDVVFIGDSLTHNGTWSEYFTDISLANRGIGGDMTTDLMRRLDSILSTTPEKAFIMIGINNFLKKESVEKVFSDYVEIVTKLREQKVDVVIQSTIQCAPTMCGPEKNLMVNDLNEKLAAYSQSQQITFIDLGQLSRPDGLEQKYTYDGLHLNSDGYKYWVEKLRPYVNTVKTSKDRIS